MEHLHEKNKVVHFAAVWLSRLFHPFFISVLVLFWVQRLLGYTFLESIGWTALSFTIVIAPVLTFIAVRIWQGRYRDIDVSVREDRHLLYGLVGLCFVLLTALLAVLHAPIIMQKTLHAALLAIMVGAIFNLFVNKLSLHSVTMAGSATVLLVVVPPVGIVFGLFGLLVAWSRLHLQRHTLPEILWGWIVGVMSVLIWFSLSPK